MMPAQMLLAGALLAISAAASPALADGSAAGALTFRHLEFEQPRDPLLSSNPVFGDVHHTPADQLAPAAAAIRAAVPAGTPRAMAEAALVRAGARCSALDAGTETCSYHDLETVDEFSDDVVWKVGLGFDGDRVDAVSVDRAWQRH
ncbi:hypothetical protein [Flavisphingomonas formosensis]|uniref:hypothetical protein n=1 Tax=Flavisphingomonas formosensis TaxID=861534 RepID=UPI0012F744D9|nr:hypothetical protein [Sphingomonas formosensis]